MLEIVNYVNLEKNKEELSVLSGYCILSIICNKLFDKDGVVNDFAIYDVFSGFDFEKKVRFSNKQYVEFAEKALRNLGGN